MSEDTQDWSDYETGPFCRHWGDPADCAIECATCGHKCTQHGAMDGMWECNEYDCACEEWKEPNT
jgi:hypothetical protein